MLKPRCLLPLLAGCLVAFALPGTAAAKTDPISWKRCTERDQRGFQCAKIRVPLNHDRPSGEKISLALIRKRATKPSRRIGSLFYEPGGPGSPGTDFLPVVYRGFPEAVRERFDLISWDPRGVGQSTAVRCFANRDALERFFAGSPTRTTDGFPVGPGQMATWIERYRGFGRECLRRNGRLLRFVSTVDTVRDLDLMRRRAGDRKMTFVGTSYGTMVGAVYANLYPKLVRAMVLDGVVDPLAWVHAQRPENGGRFLPGGLRFKGDVETAKTLDAFLERCGRAPASRCAFSAGSPAATRQKFYDLLARLPVELAPNVTTYARAINRTVHALYFVSEWAELAEVLQRLWEQGPAAVPPVEANEEGQEMAIVCGEVPSPSASDFASINAFSIQRSGVVGPFWTWDYEPCSTWPVRAVHRYTGPWNRRTANPVLVVGNTYDPSTPLRGAVAMRNALARARLVTVEGYGHTVLLNPSACWNRHAARYLVSGTLPPKGTHCPQTIQPFSD
jgi:pimeloyl-ACP methyl ester carboxylesterase